MIDLKQGQKLYVLKSGNIWFNCVAEGNGLVSYSMNPYISKVKEGSLGIGAKDGGELDSKLFLSDCNRIKKFDIKEEIKNLSDVNSYSKLVDKIMGLQDTIFLMSAANEFVKGSQHPSKSVIDSLCNEAKISLKHTEEMFKIVASKVPSNWAFAMFPESSWTAYPFLVEKHRVACGNTTRFAEGFGRTESDAKEVDRNTYEFNKALGQETDKEEKKFLDLQAQVKQLQIKEQQEERTL